MTSLPLALLVALPPLALLCVGLVPTRSANRHPRGMRGLVVPLAGLSLAAAAVAAGLLAWAGPVDRVFCEAPGLPVLNVGIFFDSLTAVMTLLIACVGFVIARFSNRYLDGDARQGRFFRWLAFTLGAVLLLVASRNLLMFTVSWILTSTGLHQLLLHYPDRPWALWAARKRLLISRIGDVFLIAALVLTYRQFGSFDYAEVFAQADALRTGGLPVGMVPAAIALLYVLGAMTKSAQFPVHSWLPDTMESPTPVSALMHAGIINAGGFLVIRLSPLVTLSPVALDILAVIGAITALVGGLVMLSQTSIKRALAFSTIAQMGFMMLQCGLGAFSAALLHVVAHSLYKAHAFLASGSVLEAAARLKTDARPQVRGLGAVLMLPVAVAGALLIGAAAVEIAEIDLATKAGGMVLGIVLMVAVTTLIWHGLVSGSVTLAVASVAGGALVTGIYLASFLAFDRLLAWSSVTRDSLPPSSVDLFVSGLVVVGFLGVFAIQTAASWLSQLPAVRALYVHASNGFYFDIPARQLTARVWGLSTPVP